jgi:glycosyltransferase involved in cell wall biosynthesis
MALSICLISMEFFHWGRYGGIGKVCRDLGRELVKRGLDVSAVIPRNIKQSSFEEVDGVKVYSHPLYMYPFSGRIYKKLDADLYHSQDPSWGTLIAMKNMNDKRHIVTIQNPKTQEDWCKVQRFYPTRRLIYNRLVEPSVHESVKRTDMVFCQAKYVTRKAQEVYGLGYEPEFLPNPVTVPDNASHKGKEPTVLFLGRLDGEKNPETFCRLAKEFPWVQFIVSGRAHSEKRNSLLRESFRNVSNLEFRGFLNGSKKNEVLEESWVIINTSVSECLPISFLEGSAYRCAILSPHDPDGFASSFGYHVNDGDFSHGLRWLLQGDRWRELGEKGYNYVKKVHEKEHVIDLHIQRYEELMQPSR